jgi:hypothetical protein
VVLRARVAAEGGRCRCGRWSDRVHGRYVRSLRDVAVGGAGVIIELQVRRFRCQNSACPAVTFAEQVHGLTTPHSRFTPLLLGLLARIGLALAGRAGARLTAALGMATGRDTLLRLVKALPEPETGAVEVLGVDDFAFRKGHHYGTVLIDMATHRPLHLFDGREGEDLAAWLRQHPEVRVICRDRSSGYGEGSRQGAPQAVRVADRFHLWQNLCQSVEKAVNTLRPHLAEPAPQPEGDGLEAEPDIMEPNPELKIVVRFKEQHAAVHELWAQGLSKAAIGRKLGLHQATVRKLVNAATAGGLTAKTLQRAHLVDPYTGYFHRRWTEGIRNAAQLFREIRQFGYPGGELAVQRHLRRYRTHRGHMPAPGPKPPSVREITAWITTHPDHLDGTDAAATTPTARPVDRVPPPKTPYHLNEAHRRKRHLVSVRLRLLRNPFRYAARQDWDKIAKVLKPVCTAPTEEAALERCAEFADGWGRKYPAIVKLWENAWEEFTPFLRFDSEIRRIVCTTNAIESVNARIRRAVKARGHFPNEQAALKCVYMAIMSLDPTGKGQASWTMRWKTALNAFDITFDGRLSAARQ